MANGRNLDGLGLVAGGPIAWAAYAVRESNDSRRTEEEKEAYIAQRKADAAKAKADAKAAEAEARAAQTAAAASKTDAEAKAKAAEAAQKSALASKTAAEAEAKAAEAIAEADSEAFAAKLESAKPFAIAGLITAALAGFGVFIWRRF